MFFGIFGKEKKFEAELLVAARTGETEGLLRILSKGALINAQEPESGDTPLIAAVDRSQWEAAEILLKHQPDLNVQDKHGQTALYLAVSKGDSALTLVNLLLANGANTELGPAIGDNGGASPLHIACALGANECVESLLRSKACVTKPLPSGAQPVHAAAIGGNHRTIKLLYMAGADLNSVTDEKRSPLHNCGITGNAKAADALLKLGVAVDPKDKDGFTPLLLAVLKGNIDVVKTLLIGGADPNAVVQSDESVLYPLLATAMYGFTKIAKLLIEKGGDVNLIEGGQYLADAAMLKGHTATAKLFQPAQEDADSTSFDQSRQSTKTSNSKGASNVGGGVCFKVTAEGKLVITAMK